MLGFREGLQRESPPCSHGGTLTATQARGRRITVTIITIYMLKSCLPQQSDKYLKIWYITGPILFLIYKVNYLYQPLLMSVGIYFINLQCTQKGHGSHSGVILLSRGTTSILLPSTVVLVHIFWVIFEGKNAVWWVEWGCMLHLKSKHRLCLTHLLYYCSKMGTFIICNNNI